MSERIIEADRSVIVAADVESSKLPDLIKQTTLVKGISGYKIGLEVGLTERLSGVVSMVKDNSDLPTIYDHQKAGNDIPKMGANFARTLRNAGVSAAIMFPFVSPVTERDWIKACQDEEIGVIVGGHMTVPNFLESEGGFIADSAPERIYTIAAEQGVTDFVVPGNKIGYVQKYKNLLDGVLGEGNFTLYAPGFITQGGEISNFAKAAGDRWHAIVGSAIYKAVDINAAARQMTSNLR